jgi:transposase
MIKPQKIPTIPRDTTRVIRAILPKGNAITRLRDEFGTIYTDQDFATLFSTTGQPAIAPWKLALITVFQFFENLTDRQAVHAVLTRIDWKYALSLKLTDPSFDHTVLSEFRSRLVNGNQELFLLDKMLEAFNAKGLLKTRGRQRTDSTHILSSARVVQRLEHVTETVRAALNALATHHPEWTQRIANPAWFERYSKRAEDYRLPRSKQAREEFLVTVGDDGYALLELVCSATAPQDALALPAVDALRRTWMLEYIREEGRSRWRSVEELGPSAQRFNSPYDVEAHHSVKRTQGWDGYKVHLTETCDVDTPNVITHVLTTSAVVADVECTQVIEKALIAKGMQPGEHVVDGAYVSAALFISSRERGTVLLGPGRNVQGWQAHKEGAYDLTKFVVNFKQRNATCPQGKVSTGWKEKRRRNRIYVAFKRADCEPCQFRALCVKSAKDARSLSILPEAEFEALQLQRAMNVETGWAQRFDVRAGIEGSLSQGVRAFGLRRSRYVGEARTRLHCVGVAVGINVQRVGAWFEGVPRAKSRVSKFGALKAAA